MSPDGRATAEATLWMTLPHSAFEHDSLEFSARGDRLLASVISKSSDIWRVGRQTR